MTRDHENDGAQDPSEHGQQTTRDIFNVLTMLVSLKQQPGDLPASSSLLIGG